MDLGPNPGPDFALEDRPDLHGELARLREAGSFARVTYGGTPAVLLLTNELVTAACKDEPTFPASAIYPLTTGPVLGHTLQCMAGAEHRVNRALVSPSFRRRLMVECAASLLEPLAHELVDRFSTAGSADLVAEFTAQYPVLVICRLLGLPVEHDETVRRWAHDLFYFPFDAGAARRASADFTDYVRPLIAARRRTPGTDVISVLTRSEFEGQRLDDEQILAFVRLLFPAGADTTVLGLGNVLSALLTHPNELCRVRSDPAAEVDWAVEEGLRWEPPVGLLPRLCPVAVSWRGVDIAAGTVVIFAITAANRDPATYPEPDRFDISRRARASVCFGDGPHTCLGTWLALAEIRAALAVLISRLPGLRLSSGAEADARVQSQLGTALRGPAALRVRWDLPGRV